MRAAQFIRAPVVSRSGEDGGRGHRDVPQIDQAELRPQIDSGVVLLPGSAMGPGGEGFVRASLAIREDRWEEAGRRIQEAL